MVIYDWTTTTVVVLAEVMGAKRESDRQEMIAVKEQLFVCFKDQMELRWDPFKPVIDADEINNLTCSGLILIHTYN